MPRAAAAGAAPGCVVSESPLMLFAARFIASVAITVWGLLMVLLGIVNGMFLWILLGLAVTAVGLPLLGSNPWMTPRLYPLRGSIGPANGAGK